MTDLLEIKTALSTACLDRFLGGHLSSKFAWQSDLSFQSNLNKLQNNVLLRNHMKTDMFAKAQVQQ